MYKPNIVKGVLTSRFSEIKTHLGHQLSFSPFNNKGHILMDNDKFSEIKVDKNGDIYSNDKLEGYDYFKNKSYIGNYNNMEFIKSK